MDELYKKIESILEAKIPDPKARENMLAMAGEIIFNRSMDSILSQLPSDKERQAFTDLIFKGDLEGVFDYTEKFGLDLTHIFEKISMEVVAEMMK